ncbi:MAG: DUF1128 family protein [Candidatus Roizmanbacteria bacterium]|nr:DUF1128 family protein [Candidatus Roizmanbacteria bacterium]
MDETNLKLQIESIEQQLKVLKAKMFRQKSHKKLSDLYGIFEGKMDFSLEEIKKHEYPAYGKV